MTSRPPFIRNSLFAFPRLSFLLGIVTVFHLCATLGCQPTATSGVDGNPAKAKPAETSPSDRVTGSPNAAPAAEGSELRIVPGLEDRTNLAPLAPLFAKADPLSDPKWRSEQFNSAAGKQLKAIGKLFDHPEDATTERLSKIIDSTYESDAIRPSLESAFRDDAYDVLRQVAVKGDAAASSDAVHRDVAGFAQALRDLTAVYRHNDGDHITVKFKVIRVDLRESDATTVAYLEASGPSSKVPDARIQQNATWTMRWVKRENEPLPFVAGIVVSDHEEVTPTGQSTGTFQDCTEAVLGGNESYHRQLSFGADHWYGNLDVAFGVHQGNQGLALGDLNGDGRDDLLVSQPAGLPLRLYIQQPDGTLLDKTKELELDWLDASRSGLFADLDNDGDQDVLVSMNYSIAIFENVGGGKLAQRTLIDIHSWPASMAAADYDLDGDLDLYICGYNPRGETAPGDVFANPVPYHDANNGARNFMMQNKGGFDFEDVTYPVKLNENNRRFSFAATWEDYDNDGDPDLYVANDFGRNNLYRNDRDKEGNITFKDVAAEAGVEDISAGMSVSWSDYNRDGLMDLYVSNMFSSAGNRITYQKQFKTTEDEGTREDIQRHARGNSLFENNGDGTFRDVSVDANVTMGRWAWGSKFADINNDGWEDIYVANGFFTTPDTGDL